MTDAVDQKTYETIRTWFDHDVSEYKDLINDGFDRNEAISFLLLAAVLGKESENIGITANKLFSLPYRQVLSYDAGEWWMQFPYRPMPMTLGRAIALEVERPGETRYRRISVGRESAQIEATRMRNEEEELVRLFFFSNTISESNIPEMKDYKDIPLELFPKLKTADQNLRH